MDFRIQKLMSMAGISSRRKAEELILAGRVRLNGAVAELGAKANPYIDILELDGKVINFDSFEEKEKIYVMLHKPEGVVTTVTDPFNRPTVMDFFKSLKTRIYPVGRLDYDTSGLLLLTNDGEWTHKITHPSNEIKKTYIAVVKGIPTETALSDFRTGLNIEGKYTAPCEISLINKNVAKGNSTLKIIIHEGRNRQVRKMCDIISHPVITLKRVAIGGLELGDLKLGEWKYITNLEGLI